MTLIKICGLTRQDDVAAAVSNGADMLGFILVKKSPRYVAPEKLESLLACAPKTVKRILVVQDEQPETLAALRDQFDFDWFQFHGSENPEQIARFDGYKVIHVANNHLDLNQIELFPGLVMLDTQWGNQKGGSGRTFDWSLLTKLHRPFLVAGGLNPDNVASLIKSHKPWAVDVSSGVEKAPGIKDHRAIAQFISQVRSCNP